MPRKPGGKRPAKHVLRLYDLDHSKTSVLQSLGSVASKRTYAYAINDFITWYCSEPSQNGMMPSNIGVPQGRSMGSAEGAGAAVRAKRWAKD